jgi:hypothetical protein
VASREIAEETGLTDLQLGTEVWHRRHVFTWRGVQLGQRERLWFLARVSRFEPSSDAMTETEKLDLKECRWWTLQELEAAAEPLTPRELAARLWSLLADGPPRHPIQIGIIRPMSYPVDRLAREPPPAYRGEREFALWQFSEDPLSPQGLTQGVSCSFNRPSEWSRRSTDRCRDDLMQVRLMLVERSKADRTVGARALLGGR